MRVVGALHRRRRVLRRIRRSRFDFCNRNCHCISRAEVGAKRTPGQTDERKRKMPNVEIGLHVQAAAAFQYKTGSMKFPSASFN